MSSRVTLTPAASRIHSCTIPSILPSCHPPPRQLTAACRVMRVARARARGDEGACERERDA
eukprot:3071526-Rhodomonas_salina.1